MPVISPDTSAAPSTGVTVNALIQDTLRHLNVQSSLNKLAQDASSSAGTLTFTYELKGITAGARIAIGQEVFYVWDVNPGAKTATVHRAFDGSLAATHATGALVYVNPRYTPFQLSEELRKEIASWPTTLFAVASTNLTTSLGVRGYDLASVPANYYFPLDVSIGPVTGDTTNTWTRAKYSIANDQSGYASGTGLILHTEVSTGRTVRFTYAKPFDLSTWNLDTDVEADVGLTSTMVDIPPLGVAAKLLSTSEVRRTQMHAQPDSRRAEEVPVTSMSQAANNLRRLRDQRIAEEGARLRTTYPLVGW